MEKRKRNTYHGGARRYDVEEESPAASATYYCFDHRATMAAILDMRKYPPHCPRLSTNSPIHPRADSTLQPAAAAAPLPPRSTIQRPSLTELPLCLPACLPVRSPPPRPFKVRADAFLRAHRLPFFFFHQLPNFLLFYMYIRCRTIRSSLLFSKNF